MDQLNYEQIIVAGIRHLPAERLREVADFVYFLRQREERPNSFPDEEHHQIIERDLADLGRGEASHLEAEFENYEQFYPRR